MGHVTIVVRGTVGRGMCVTAGGGQAFSLSYAVAFALLHILSAYLVAWLMNSDGPIGTYMCPPWPRPPPSTDEIAPSRAFSLCRLPSSLSACARGECDCKRCVFLWICERERGGGGGG